MATLIAFRVDASLEIGTGHVMRCLALANELSAHGARCVFVTRPFPGHLNDTIRQNGHHLVELPIINKGTPGAKSTGYGAWLGTDWATDASQTLTALGGRQVDWLVVDHYALDAQWEAVVASGCRHVMAIDDLANRKHECDLLLDQNAGRLGTDYTGLLPKGCEQFVGPKFALLRPEFSRWRNRSLTRRTTGRFENLLITMGGVDRDNVTGLVLDNIKQCNLPTSVKVTVVLGRTAPWADSVKNQAAGMNRPVRVLVGVRNIAGLMAESDIAIGAAGVTALERCALGLPTIVVVLACNQSSGARNLMSEGALLGVLEIHEIVDRLPNMLDPQERKLIEIAAAASKITDGYGARRIREKMLLENE